MYLLLLIQVNIIKNGGKKSETIIKPQVLAKIDRPNDQRDFNTKLKRVSHEPAWELEVNKKENAKTMLNLR